MEQQNDILPEHPEPSALTVYPSMQALQTWEPLLYAHAVQKSGQLSHNFVSLLYAKPSKQLVAEHSPDAVQALQLEAHAEDKRHVYIYSVVIKAIHRIEEDTKNVASLLPWQTLM